MTLSLTAGLHFSAGSSFRILLYSLLAATLYRRYQCTVLYAISICLLNSRLHTHLLCSRIQESTFKANETINCALSKRLGVRKACVHYIKGGYEIRKKQEREQGE